MIAYSDSGQKKFSAKSLDQIRHKTASANVVWVNIVGLADIDMIRSFGVLFGIHQLTLEDIVNVHQRAKFESFKDYDYIVTRMARFNVDETARSIQTEQLSILLIDKFVFTFQVVAADCLDPIRRRIEERTGLICSRGSDYLVYALIDTVIDHYFPLLDQLSELVAEIDDALITQDSTVSVKEIHRLRRDLLNLSRHVRPHREMLGRLLREPSKVGESTRVFLADCFDHTLQLSESIDLNREICSDLRSYHLALVGNRTNDVMKTLTIVSTIFIPLSFIAGLYGMNFEYMPELKWSFGYFAALISMAAVAGGLLFWFRSRGWFDRVD